MLSEQTKVGGRVDIVAAAQMCERRAAMLIYRVRHAEEIMHTDVMGNKDEQRHFDTIGFRFHRKFSRCMAGERCCAPLERAPNTAPAQLLQRNELGVPLPPPSFSLPTNDTLSTCAMNFCATNFCH